MALNPTGSGVGPVPNPMGQKRPTASLDPRGRTGSKDPNMVPPSLQKTTANVPVHFEVIRRCPDPFSLDAVHSVKE